MEYTDIANDSFRAGFEQFCGGPFWNHTLSWDQDIPDLTLCFQRSVVVWAPCLYLWLALPLYTHHLCSLLPAPILRNGLNRTKLLVTMALGAVVLIDLVRNTLRYQSAAAVDTITDSNAAADSQTDTPLVLVVSSAILLATLVAVGAVIEVERVKGFITSGVLWVWWLFAAVCGGAALYSYILRLTRYGWDGVEQFRLASFCTYYFGVLIQFIIASIAEQVQVPTSNPTKVACPEVTASFPSRIMYCWINRLVYSGYKKSLDEGDVWELHPRDLCRNNGPRLEQAWREELKRCHWNVSPDPLDTKLQKGSTNGIFRKLSGSYGATDSPSAAERGVKRLSAIESSASGGAVRRQGPLKERAAPSERVSLMAARNQRTLSVTTPPVRGNPSFVRALAKIFGPSLIVAQLCKLMYDCLIFLGPILQRQLIEFIETPGLAQWKGLVYAAGFFLCGVIQCMFFHQLFHISMTCGMRIKSAIIAVIFKKALTMSNEARKDVTVGEIVNLMSVDAQRIQDVTGYIWMLWSSPLQICIAITMLWGIMGPSVLAGLAVMIALIPMNGVMAWLQRKLQISQMGLKDKRIKLMNEVLNGIRVLKLYAWELSFKEKLDAIRGVELDTLRKYSYFSAVGTFTWTCAPFIVTLATFATYVAVGNTLDASTAFVALSLFNILRFPINMMPMMISFIVTASVSVKRITKFLSQGDIDVQAIGHKQHMEDPVVVKHATFSWGRGEDVMTVLTDIDMRVKDKELVAVVGPVGCGKSSLMSAILGEMEKLDGYVNLRGRVAYVAQQVLENCALKPDLEILPGGDQTEIGEKGINLSGGQKQRVSLARALYSEADIYILDDPLSAVDSHVGKHIFEKVIANDTGQLREKTRLFVTHGLHWLPQVDRVLVIERGHIAEQGTYDELLQQDGPFARLATQYITQTEDVSDEEDYDADLEDVRSELLQRVEAIQQDVSRREFHRQLSDVAGVALDETGSDTTDSVPTLSRSHSRAMSRKASQHSTSRTPRGTPHPYSRQRSGASRVSSTKLVPRTPVRGEKLIEAETSETGEVKMAVFLGYAKALGYVNALFILSFFLLYQVASVGSNLWLTAWTEDPLLVNVTEANTTAYSGRQDFYLGVYGGLGLAQAVFVLLYSIVTAYSMVLAARELHDAMLSNVLRSPMAFFDTTPIGRVLNRFSRDVETIDNVLPQLFRSWFSTMFAVVATVVVISLSTPLFLAIILPLAIVYYFIQRFYIPTSRQLKRIESTTRSPIYTHFSETITGSSTIRAYGEQQRFISKSNVLVDHNLVFYFASIASNRWLGVRLEFLGAFIVFFAAVFSVLGKGSLSGGLVGLSISYALQVTQSLNWMVRMTSDLESNVVSVERVKEYAETPQEAVWQVEATQPPRSWPDRGEISLEKYSCRYRPELDLVLKEVTVNISAGEKVGVVGRTGAGKSSLALSLFRLVEPAAGAIVIDGVQIAELGLHQLRSRLTILPQDPVLFSGSLHMNLDPFDMFGEGTIWEALEQAHLRQFVQSLPAGLDYECGEGGVNLSVGQRQLVCLARTLLRKTQILILDEATAAVDLETDELIQGTIRDTFAACTVLTIAHRLNTIMDSDRVLVLDSGRVAEFDTPAALLDNPQSVFRAMARDAGLVT